MMPILANTITADMGLIPGMAIISPLFGLPLSVLAAVIERPFYTAAGVERHSVWYSIQANVVSLLIGYPIVLLVALLSDVVGEVILALWPFAAVAISTYIERRYLNAKARVRRPLPFGPVLGANMLSALVCVLILVPLHTFDRPDVKLAPTAVSTAAEHYPGRRLCRSNGRGFHHPAPEKIVGACNASRRS